MRSKFPTAEIIKDYESGINFKRKGLQTLLERIMREDELRIIVAHWDRLARFGGEVIQFLVEQNGREVNECGVIVIDVCEAYTSKTVSWTGDVIGNLGGQKTIKDGVGNVMDRDLNGARGIFVKNIASALKVLPIS